MLERYPFRVFSPTIPIYFVKKKNRVQSQLLACLSLYDFWPATNCSWYVLFSPDLDLTDFGKPKLPPTSVIAKLNAAFNFQVAAVVLDGQTLATAIVQPFTLASATLSLIDSNFLVTVEKLLKFPHCPSNGTVREEMKQFVQRAVRSFCPPVGKTEKTKGRVLSWLIENQNLKYSLQSLKIQRITLPPCFPENLSCSVRSCSVRFRDLQF